MTVTLLPVAQPRLIHRPYVILAGLQALDVISTGIILRFFEGSAEGNPITRALFTGAGLWLGLLILLVFKLGTVALWWSCQTGVRIATTLYSLVIFNNILFGVLWMYARWL